MIKKSLSLNISNNIVIKYTNKKFYNSKNDLPSYHYIFTCNENGVHLGWYTTYKNKRIIHRLNDLPSFIPTKNIRDYKMYDSYFRYNGYASFVCSCTLYKFMNGICIQLLKCSIL